MKGSDITALATGSLSSIITPFSPVHLSKNIINAIRDMAAINVKLVKFTNRLRNIGQVAANTIPHPQVGRLVI
jgi:hypothetical protein